MRAEIGADDATFVVGWAGRLTAIKRPLDLIRTLRALVDRQVDALLVLVGDGEDRAAVEALAAELGVADRCRLVGFQKSIRPWYASFDALLLTSANEGTPVVAIEALAAARPVVATRAGGTGTVVKNGESGYLEAIGDTAALADRLAMLAARPRAARADGLARGGGRAGAVRGRPDGGRGRGGLPPAARGEGPPPAQGDRRQRLGRRTCSRCCPPCASAASTPASSGSTFPDTDAGRLYEHLDRLGVPHRSVRCGFDVSPRMARDVVRAVRAEQPDLVHTHLVHADVYGGIAARALGIRAISTRHNDDRYLLGPFRYVDRAFARPARKLIAISDAVRRFLERAGHDPAKLVTIRYGLDELPAAPSDPTPAAAGIPADAPLARRGRTADRAEGSRDAAARLRVRASRAPAGASRHPRQRPARGRDAAARCRVGAGGRGHASRPHRHPRLARASGRLRAHIALGRLRDRAARGDAGRAPNRRDARERSAGGRGRRRDRAPRRPRRPRRAWPRRWERCSRTAPARPPSAKQAGGERWTSSPSDGWPSAPSPSTTTRSRRPGQRATVATT